MERIVHIKCLLLFIYMIFSLFPARIMSQVTEQQNPMENKVEVFLHSTSLLEEAGADGIAAEVDQLVFMLDLNQSTPEEVLAFPLLTEDQKYALLEYREKTGRILSIYELMQIRGFDIKTIVTVLPYLTLSNSNNSGNRNLLRELKRSRHRLTVNVRLKSNSNTPAEDINSFYGSPYRYMIKYRMQAGDRIRIGAKILKDPGERLSSKKFQGVMDNSSLYIMLRINKVFRKILIGDYNIQLGQGLNMGSGFSLSGGLDPNGIKRFSGGIMPSVSTNKNYRFRGLASSIKLGPVVADLFFSYQGMDAKIYTDSNELYFRKFNSTGYYRNEDENEGRSKVLQNMVGSNICYHGKFFNIGIVAHSIQYSITRKTNNSAYETFNWTGKVKSIGGIYFRLLLKKTGIFGEYSMDDNFNHAWLAGLTLLPDPRIKIVLLARDYGLGYQNMYGSAYGVNSMNSNERGYYAGMAVRLRRRIYMKLAADVAILPWISYRKDFPSRTSRYLFQVIKEFNVEKSIVFSLIQKYYNVNNLESNYNTHISGERSITSLKVSVNTNLSRFINYRVSMYGRQLGVGDGMQDFSFMHHHMISCLYMKGRLGIHGGYGGFIAEDYGSRIYANEKDLYNELSFPSYYGKGEHFFLMINFLYNKRLKLWLRWAKTVFDYPTANTTTESFQVKSEYKFQCIFNL